MSTITYGDLLGLKEQHLRTTLGISKEGFARILTFVDFANVNHWFGRDDKDEDGAPLPVGVHLNIDLRKTAELFSLFAQDTRFYYVSRRC